MCYWDFNVREKKPCKEVFVNYLVTQKLGKYNMLSKEARKDVGCAEGEYNYIVKHYEELVKEFGIDSNSSDILTRVHVRKKYGF